MHHPWILQDGDSSIRSIKGIEELYKSRALMQFRNGRLEHVRLDRGRYVSQCAFLRWRKQCMREEEKEKEYIYRRIYFCLYLYQLKK